MALDPHNRTGLFAPATPDELTMRDIGRKGGETTRNRYGPKHFAEIGRKGGRERLLALVKRLFGSK